MTDDRLKAFPSILREKRKEKKLKQEQLADMVGVNRGTISFWECGKRPPDLDNLLKLSTVLGCTCSDLLGEKPSADAVAAFTGISTNAVRCLLACSNIKTRMKAASEKAGTALPGIHSVDALSMLLNDEWFLSALNAYIDWRYQISQTILPTGMKEVEDNAKLLEFNKRLALNAFDTFLTNVDYEILKEGKGGIYEKKEKHIQG